jgi:hypothetical protein
MRSWRMRWGRVQQACEEWEMHTIERPEGLTTLRRTGHRWVNIIKMALRNRVWQCELGSSGSGKSPVTSS